MEQQPGPMEHPLRYVLTHPGSCLAQTWKGFNANQGLLLAGAVAYYTLLSIVPLLILIVIVLSHVIDQYELLSTLQRYRRRGTSSTAWVPIASSSAATILSTWRRRISWARSTRFPISPLRSANTCVA